MKSIKVLSLNCLGTPSFNKKTRFSLLVKEIKKLKPDFISLQEVIFGNDREVLEEALKSEGYSFFPKEHRYFGGAIVSLSKLPVVSQEFVKYKEQGPMLPFSLAMRAVRKGFQISTVELKGTKFKILNTHLMANFHNTQREVRAIKNQMDELVAYIKSQPKGSKIILCGDFNIPAGGNLYKSFVKKAKLIDPLVDGNSVTFSPENLNRKYKLRFLMDGWGKREGLRLDYMFHKGFKQSSVTQKVVFDTPLRAKGKALHVSDHFGILSEILFI